MYVKTQWVDNTTPINSTNMNKIEQGIYDNSLVADAVNNVVKPNDETYKDVEITEGQITDVLAVNDVLIKGQTSQDGEPTPDSPIDINVVSGSNIVYTSNKNLFNISNIIDSVNIDANGNIIDSTDDYNLYYISVISGEEYTMTTGQSRQWVYAFSKTIPNKGQQLSTRVVKISTIETFTVPDGYNYVVVRQIDGGGEVIHNLMILKGTYTTAPGYVPHQGKELPLDLPVENLFVPTLMANNTNITQTRCTVSLNNDEYTFLAIGTDCYFGDITPSGSSYNERVGLLYDVENLTNIIFKPTNPIFSKNYVCYYNNNKVSLGYEQINNNTGLITLIANTKYISFRIGISEPVINNSYLTKIQLEKSSKANAYTPYGTEPIELCKVGDYQDYFWKDNGKWYLHKEIGKVIVDGSEGWQLSASYSNNTRFSPTNSKLILGINNKLIANYFIEGVGGTDTTNIDINGNSGNLMITIPNSIANTVDSFENWLSNNNVIVYYSLTTATDTEITDTTLISQLEAIYNAPLYEQTNITQTNNDLPIVLDITACKDNINGIKAWIRK